MEEDDRWRLIAPTEAGPQPGSTGGQITVQVSHDQGAHWAKLQTVPVFNGRNADVRSQAVARPSRLLRVLGRRRCAGAVGVGPVLRDAGRRGLSPPPDDGRRAGEARARGVALTRKPAVSAPSGIMLVPQRLGEWECRSRGSLVCVSVLCALAALSLCAGCARARAAGGESAGHRAGGTQPTHAVKKGRLALKVEAAGTFLPANPVEVRIRPEAYEGELKILAAAANGAAVKKGDTSCKSTPPSSIASSTPPATS